MDLDQALVDLGDLELEHLGEELGGGARHDYLRPLRGLADVHEVRADAVADAVLLAGQALPVGHHGFRAAEVDDDRTLGLALDDAAHDLADALLVLLEYDTPLGLAQPLDNHLLGDLGGVAAEDGGRNFEIHLVAHFGLRVHGPRLLQAYLQPRLLHLLDDGAARHYYYIAGLVQKVYVHLRDVEVAAARRRVQSRLQRFDDDLALDVLGAGQLVHHLVELNFVVHSGSNP